MKNAKLFFAAFIFSLGLFFSRCTPDTAGLVSSTEEVLVKNVWSIDYYFNNQDMTNNFGSSRLLFSSTGSVGYQKNGETISGTWSKTADASNNEFINLHFNTKDADVSRLNESWMLTSRSASSIQFVETGGTGILFRIKVQ
jgi:hypothetical protein